MSRPLWRVLLALRECLLQWDAMQRSTTVYVDNALHDTRARTASAERELGCLAGHNNVDAEMRAGYAASSERMLKALFQACTHTHAHNTAFSCLRPYVVRRDRQLRSLSVSLLRFGSLAPTTSCALARRTITMSCGNGSTICCAAAALNWRTNGSV